jgi:hypothetical protein
MPTMLDRPKGIDLDSIVLVPTDGGADNLSPRKAKTMLPALHLSLTEFIILIAFLTFLAFPSWLASYSFARPTSSPSLQNPPQSRDCADPSRPSTGLGRRGECRYYCPAATASNRL